MDNLLILFTFLGNASLDVFSRLFNHLAESACNWRLYRTAAHRAHSSRQERKMAQTKPRSRRRAPATSGPALAPPRRLAPLARQLRRAHRRQRSQAAQAKLGVAARGRKL